jgi:hypothetical protein
MPKGKNSGRGTGTWRAIRVLSRVSRLRSNAEDEPPQQQLENPEIAEVQDERGDEEEGEALEHHERADQAKGHVEEGQERQLPDGLHVKTDAAKPVEGERKAPARGRDHRVVV